MSIKPSRTILVAEDDLICQHVLGDSLREDGYTVVLVEDGDRVMESARAVRPDLILLDVMMPGADGFELCRRFRADPELGDVPIIMLTSLEDDESRIKAIELGADEFLTKPVNEAELRARVRTILQLYGFRRLLAQRSKFEQLIELAPDGIVIVSEDGRIRVANRAFRRMLRWEEGEELGGLSILDWVGEGQRETFSKELRPLTQRDGRSAYFETWFQPRGGGSFSAEVTAGYFEWDTAPALEILVRDTTEKKRLQSQFLRMQRLQSVGTLASGIAHDIKNSLSPILLSVHMARRNLKDPVLNRYFDTIERSARRSTDVIQQILAFARGEEGDRRLLQPSYVVRELEKILSQALPPTIRLTCDIPEKPWLVSGDATQLHQVLMNLCVNARDAMPRGGMLALRLLNVMLDEREAAVVHAEARAGAYVRMSVADSGTGISPEVRDKLFEPFVTTKEIGRGTGLGLSSALGIVRAHGGFIDVDSVLGQGTTFSVFLPATTGAENVDGEEGGQLELVRGNGETLMVVDDSVDVREALAEALSAYGYKVLTAREGPEALALFVRHRLEIRLVMVDFRMPLMDGLCTIRAIRYVDSEVRFILLNEVENEGRGGVDGELIPCLVKPFSVEDLLRTVSEHLGTSSRR